MRTVMTAQFIIKHIKRPSAVPTLTHMLQLNAYCDCKYAKVKDTDVTNVALTFLLSVLMSKSTKFSYLLSNYFIESGIGYTQLAQLCVTLFVLGSLHQGIFVLHHYFNYNGMLFAGSAQSET